MPISVSTDPIRPAERHAFWTDAISRNFAPIETRPLGSSMVSGCFEFVEIGAAKLVRFDSSPQFYRRDARLVSRSGSDEFMFDFQRRGQSAMVQGRNEGTIAPGYGVLYDARRPFEDRLYGPEHRSEVLIATVPAASLLRAFPQAETFCARPVPLSATIARAIAAIIRDAIDATDAAETPEESNIISYLAALLRMAAGDRHELTRSSLFNLLDAYLKANITAIRPAETIAAEFGISERTFHRVFADRDTTFERRVARLRVELLRKLLAAQRETSIAALAAECGFADAAHAARTFRSAFGMTPRDFRSGPPIQRGVS
jgi:AraC family transcriptional regulator, positive regulator of tynA and feaB